MTATKTTSTDRRKVKWTEANAYEHHLQFNRKTDQKSVIVYVSQSYGDYWLSLEGSHYKASTKDEMIKLVKSLF